MHQEMDQFDSRNLTQEQRTFYLDLNENEKYDFILFMKSNIYENDIEMQNYIKNNFVEAFQQRQSQRVPQNNKNMMVPYQNQHAIQNNKKDEGSKSTNKLNKNQQQLKTYQIPYFSFQGEMDIQPAEIENIEKRTNIILNQNSLNELHNVFTQIQQKVKSLFDNNIMVQQSQKLMKDFYSGFEFALSKSVEQNGKLIFNRLEEFLNQKYSARTQKDLYKISISIINECNSRQIQQINQVAVLNQFKKYIITGMSNEINTNVFLCVSENDFNQCIQQSIQDFINQNEQITTNSTIFSHFANAAKPDRSIQNGMNSLSHQANNNANQIFNQGNLQNEANHQEIRFMTTSNERITSYCDSFFNHFNQSILEKIQQIYQQKVDKIKHNLYQANTFIENLQDYRKAPNQLISNRNTKYEQCMQNLSRAIYYKKTQLKLKEIADEFDNLNNIVNKMITSEINQILEQIKQDHINKNEQPILYSNLFDHMIDQIIKGISQLIIPRSLEKLLTSKTNLDHLKNQIKKNNNENYEKFLNQANIQSNEGIYQYNNFMIINIFLITEIVNQLSVHYFSQFQTQISKLSENSMEWLFYFVEKMSVLQKNIDHKNKYLLMLHEISFGELTKIKEYQNKLKNSVEDCQTNISKLWQSFEQKAQETNLKSFAVKIIDINMMLDSDSFDGKISVFQQSQFNILNYRISYQNIELNQKLIVRDDKMNVFKDILNWIISHKNDFQIILTLFFFYHYEKIQNKEITFKIFTCKNFFDYLDDTIIQVKNFNKLFNYSTILQEKYFDHEIIFNQKMNMNLEQLQNHVDCFYKSYEQYIHSQNVQVRHLSYFQHFINSDNQLASFFSGSQYGEFILGIENLETNWTDENSNLCLVFNNYYSQQIFTAQYNDQIHKNQIQILFFYFCLFLKCSFINNVQLQEFQISINEELLRKFQIFIEGYKETASYIYNDPLQYLKKYQNYKEQQNQLNLQNQLQEYIQSAEINKQIIQDLEEKLSGQEQEYNLKLIELQLLNQKQNEFIDDQNQNISTLKFQIQQLQIQKEDQQNQINYLNENNEKMRTIYQTEVNKASVEVRQINQKLTKEQEGFQTTIRDKDEEINRLNQQDYLNNQQLRQIQIQMQSHKVQTDELQSLLSLKEQQLQENKSQFQEYYEKSQQNLTTLNQDNKKLLQENNILQSNCKQLVSCHQINNFILSIKQQILSFQQNEEYFLQNPIIQQNINVISEISNIQLNQFKIQQEELGLKIKISQTSVDKLQEQMNQLQQCLSNLEEQKTQKQQQLQNFDLQIKQNIELLKQQTNQVEQLEIVQQEIKKLRQELSITSEKSQTKQQELSQTLNQLDETKQQLKNIYGEIEKKQNIVEELIKKQNELQQNEEIEKQLQSKSITNTQLEYKNQQFNQQSPLELQNQNQNMIKESLLQMKSNEYDASNPNLEIIHSQVDQDNMQSLESQITTYKQESTINQQQINLFNSLIKNESQNIFKTSLDQVSQNQKQQYKTNYDSCLNQCNTLNQMEEEEKIDCQLNIIDKQFELIPNYFNNHNQNNVKQQKYDEQSKVTSMELENYNVNQIGNMKSNFSQLEQTSQTQIKHSLYLQQDNLHFNTLHRMNTDNLFIKNYNNNSIYNLEKKEEIESQKCNNLEDLNISHNFEFQIFFSLLNNYKTNKNLLQQFEEKHKCRILIDIDENNLGQEILNLSNRLSYNTIVVLNRKYNAFVLIQQRFTYFSSFKLYNLQAQSNISICNDIQNTQFGQIIQQHAGNIEKKIKLANEQIQTYELEKLLYEHINSIKQMDIFQFICNEDIFFNIKIICIEKIYSENIRELLFSFKEQMNKNILVLITKSVLYTLFRYFSKTQEGEPILIHEILITTSHYSPDIYVKKVIDTEQIYHQILTPTKNLIQLQIPGTDKERLVNLFMVTYIPQQVQKQLSNDYLKQIIQDTEHYHNFIQNLYFI